VFKHEGPARSPRKNAVLAGYLALVAGFVNSSGFVLIGSFSSHVTGNVGRFSIDLAKGHLGAALSAAGLVGMFFAGAFVASLVVETNLFESTARAYGFALLIEALLLIGFIFLVGFSVTHPDALDGQAGILCIAMGMQNSLVTRLSGAVVRTTHLTGVVTDLGIELARWYRWHRAKLRALPALLPGRSPPVRPQGAPALLLSTILGAFSTGAVLGAFTTLRIGRWSFGAPAIALLAASAYAYYDGIRAKRMPEEVRSEVSFRG
jgi:uncharacterized membrane protein YoaK (UPF0700 family)